MCEQRLPKDYLEHHPFPFTFKYTPAAATRYKQYQQQAHVLLNVIRNRPGIKTAVLDTRQPYLAAGIWLNTNLH